MGIDDSQCETETERSERRNRAFKWDFVHAMLDDLPEDAKERLREEQ